MKNRKLMYYRQCFLPVSELSQLVIEIQSEMFMVRSGKFVIHSLRIFSEYPKSNRTLGILSRELIKDHITLLSNLHDDNRGHQIWARDFC